MAAMAATTTERPAPRPTAGPDRLSVALFVLAGFLSMLAVMAWQLGAGASARPRPVVAIRRIYETRVVETIVGGTGGSSVTQSTSSSGSLGSSAPATTRSS